MQAPDVGPKDFIIIGGGLVGWLAAIVMLDLQASYRVQRGTSGQVILIRSSRIAPIGVGESATGQLVALMRAHRVDWRAFVRAARATFKLGTRYEGWSGSGSAYWAPLDNPDDMLELGLTRSSVSQRATLADGEPLHRAHLNGWLLETGRVPAVQDEMAIEWLPTGSWHFDAGLAGRFMERVALARGAKLVEAEVLAIDRDEAGGIERLLLEGGGKLRGGFYFDCTGQRRITSTGDDWHDLSDRVMLNCAVAGFVKQRDGIQTYTRATAARSGWIWQIPTQDRIGVGYVHQSADLTPDAARAELSRLCGGRVDWGGTVRFSPGYRRRPWTGNNVAIGLAAGFFEPLEATSIHLAITQLQAIAASLGRLRPDCEAGALHVAAQSYNAWSELAQEDMVDFIQLHYAATGVSRPFWRDAARAARQTRLHAAVHDCGSEFPPDSAMCGRSGMISPTLILPVLAGLNLLRGRPHVSPEESSLARRMRSLHAEFGRSAMAHEHALHTITAMTIPEIPEARKELADGTV